jgi:predicted amidohydrolase YtcJ
MLRLIILVAMLGIIAGESAGQSAVTVLHNARIYTVDDARPTAEAMAFHEGRLLAVGASGEVLAQFPDAERIAAGGRTVVPGLIDAHAHLMGLGQSLLQADLVGARSVEEAVARLAAFEEGLPDGAWLQGRGWDQNEWPGADFPTAADLDAAFPNRRVYLTRVDGHAAWVNTAAMRAVGGLDDAADPAGGRILRDASGAPTGVLVDAAMALVRDAIPAPSTEEARLALQRALAETARFGLTGIHDAGISLAHIRLYEEAIAGRHFPIRVYGMIGGPGATLDHFCEHGPLEHASDRLTVRSIKLYSDGALGSRGAALLEEYADEPGNEGLLLFTPDEYEAVVQRAAGCGLQVNTHAIGDRGVRLVLDTYESIIAASGQAGARHRVEHAQVVAPEDFPRFAELGVIASVQPIHATSDMGWAEARVGEDRIRGAYAWRTLVESGARLALGSDFPVEPVNPLLGFHAAVTRQDASGEPPDGWFPDQVLTREEALRGFTLDAAFAGFMEDTVGSLEPGKRADFVILDRDIMSIPTDEILRTRVVATYLDGAAVFTDHE